jgi:hypothetical protein
LQAIRKNFSKGKITSILGHEPDARFFTSHSQKYSLSVEEGNYSTSQRQMELQQLLHFREIGLPIANKSIIRAAFISNKSQVQADMDEEMQQQQQQQVAQSEQQGKIDNSKVMASFAKAKSDLAREKDLMASAQERMAKIHDINASAEHKEMEADLNLVKLAMELEDVQFNQIRDAFEFAQARKTTNEANLKQQQAQNQPAMTG